MSKYAEILFKIKRLEYKKGKLIDKAKRAVAHASLQESMVKENPFDMENRNNMRTSGNYRDDVLRDLDNVCYEISELLGFEGR